jgi:hypothetical protein
MKTTVEWLAQELTCTELRENPQWVQDVVQQAKEMEWEQIIDTYVQGCEKGEMFNNENRAFTTDAEQYYNETFKL